MSRLTLLATTDVHGAALNWDYYRDQPWTGEAEAGLAQLSTVVERIRAERGAESVVLVDNGDTIQGNPLCTFFARHESGTGDLVHPLAAAFNVMGYDAVNIGNHEFNYGLDFLYSFEQQLDPLLLGANVVDPGSGLPVFPAFTPLIRRLDGREIRIGVLGLTTPGAMIWDRQQLAGKVDVTDMVAAASHWVPKLREEFLSDVVVVLCHAGIGQTTYATNADAPAENPAKEIAEQVPGIDVMVIGHTHRDEPERWVTCEATGRPVLLTQPRAHAAGLTETVIEAEHDGDSWRIEVLGATPHHARGEVPDLRVLDAVAEAHAATRAHVNRQVAVSPRELSTADSRWRATGVIDFIQRVQATTVAEALAGGEHEALPVVSLTAPTSRTAVIPEGPVSIRDLAGVYVFDNTLAAVLLTGAELRAHLEHAARYYADLPRGRCFDPATMTGAERDGQTIWDYQYDIAWGVEYEINLNEPVGRRIGELRHPDGRPVAAADRFAVALNHYRLSGAGDYRQVANAPVLYNDMLDIRQLLIDWALTRGIDVPEEENWRLVFDEQLDSMNP
ncbi:bifunctional metallophosphatase/5'-nucleotidase [Arachnia propionica]|uniref:5'-nucleotidase C-terminal domain-containing protein n=1 Tax=Arachnia propionica TaxID=1750 RepID=A0AB37HX68_9ACTN|nr:5'-nucleotidase C-terminal domain-containing protein [Arachnia propionica]AFN44917.1 5'-nucleotidase, C-terminal domain protein [Arachnia propionica F0230a]QCT38501.1 bifunctional metallophosphatase/5'-nucleotidase [Arachnia propionica]QUC11905.1 5'-nucleotidase C-terminal domain-containing protein [Arachnia propionica]RPA18716.1 bifunctional metallophosphatase/5'-nucleotidase [Arachnia propionica]